MKLKSIYKSYNTYKRARTLLHAAKRPYCAAVIVAAGSASRMQGQDKIVAPLAGEPVLCRTLAAFEATPVVQEIVVVTREDRLEEISALASRFSKVRLVVPGGETRTESVRNGVLAVSDKTVTVAVHDGARPLITPEIINTTIRKAEKFGAAAPAIPVKDTIKVSADGSVQDTPDRSKLFAVQTPQCFDRDLLLAALEHAAEKELPVTDDCSAVEALGMKVILTGGSEENLKITTPLDLELAEVIWDRRQKSCASDTAMTSTD